VGYAILINSLQLGCDSDPEVRPMDTKRYKLGSVGSAASFGPPCFAAPSEIRSQVSRGPRGPSTNHADGFSP
jgi:hypothetical protein